MPSQLSVRPRVMAAPTDEERPRPLERFLGFGQPALDDPCRPLARRIHDHVDGA